MKKNISAAAALLLASALLSAQNVNQTVSVTNDYKSALPEFEKKTLEVAVPDTLLVFDYKFDYSVFDSPYKGAYEFSPYTVNLTPKVRSTYYNKLYVRAGAGYTLHPQLDAVYELRPLDNLSLSLFGTGDGYAGKYSAVGSDLGVDPSSSRTGHDFSTRWGVSGRAAFLRSDLTFEAAYNGIFASSLQETSRYNGATVGARLKSNGERGSYFYYDISAAYTYGHDSFVTYGGGISDNDFLIKGTVGPVLDGKYRFLCDFSAETDYTLGQIESHNSLFKAVPRLEFGFGPVSVSAGAMMGFASGENMVLRPDLRADARFFSGVLDVWARVKGDESVASYNVMKQRSHFYTAPWNAGTGDFEYEKSLDASIGAAASVGSFSGELSAGYSFLRNSMCETFCEGFALDGTPGGLCEAYRWLDYNQLHAEAAADWTSERLQVDALMGFRLTDFMGETPDVYAVPMLSGNLRAVYNWSRRIFAGVWVQGCTSRSNPSSENLSVPGWINLGLSGRYVLSQTWSLWAEAGNLLNQNIRNELLYVRRGPWLTVGACLTL